MSWELDINIYPYPGLIALILIHSPILYLLCSYLTHYSLEETSGAFLLLSNKCFSGISLPLQSFQVFSNIGNPAQDHIKPELCYILLSSGHFQAGALARIVANGSSRECSNVAGADGRGTVLLNAGTATHQLTANTVRRNKPEI